MFEIRFYRAPNGKEPVREYIESLRDSEDKRSKSQLKRVQFHINLLRENGVCIGEPYVKKLDGDIYELRPGDDRVLFATLVRGQIILLHTFAKKTQKTPKREIDKAKSELAEVLDDN